jgi:hypothetical protein
MEEPVQTAHPSSGKNATNSRTVVLEELAAGGRIPGSRSRDMRTKGLRRGCLICRVGGHTSEIRVDSDNNEASRPLKSVARNLK